MRLVKCSRRDQRSTGYGEFILVEALRTLIPKSSSGATRGQMISRYERQVFGPASLTSVEVHLRLIAPARPVQPMTPDPQLLWVWPEGGGDPVRGGAPTDGSDPLGHFPGDPSFRMPKGV
jgi:hypothetical protein